MKTKTTAWLLFLLASFCLWHVCKSSASFGRFVVKNDGCPNPNVTFWLYSNATRDVPLLLNPIDLRNSDFQQPRPVKIVLHGYLGHRDTAPNDDVRPALLDNEDAYVISIDYNPLVNFSYRRAVYNLPLVSKCLAQLIDNLIEGGIVQNDGIHVIGFSLGAMVAGQTANYLKRKLKRITGLDPAKPLFIFGNDRQILDPSDADFVDVIHTDPLKLGMQRALGHADFYPNGAAQPGCLKTIDPACSHERVTRYYAESIYTKVGFSGRQCFNWETIVLQRCPRDAPTALMGYHVSKETRGIYYLRTGSKPPFALGKEE